MQILGGVVRYEDGIKTTAGDQFSPTRKVAVELNFTLDATDANGSTDPAIHQVLDKAEAFVNSKLGIVTKTLTRAGEVKVTAKEPVIERQGYNPETHEVVDGKIVPKKKAPRVPKTPERTKADLEREAGLTGPMPGKEAPKTAPDPDELTTSAEVSAPATPAADPNDISDLLAGTEAAKPITDADLNDLAQKTMQRINKPENPGGPRIREMIKGYLPEGSQPVMAKIPADKRHEFKEKLDALK
jgi:hypothetical protein